MNGTPPRVWGQRRSRPGKRGGGRNTPTCVGTTAYRSLALCVGEEHPHVCGDNDQPGLNCLNDHGTPPRVWGQPNAVSVRMQAIRNTPTCVGTTFASPPAATGDWEHPHVCGDNIRFFHPTTTPRGTPPRVWGQHGCRAHFSHPQWNTPTCVGTTQSDILPGGDCKEHPHVCGDNPSPAFSISGAFGTPPRVWGQPLQMIQRTGRRRNTPTCVGTTS